jgi:hypothetical protein
MVELSNLGVPYRNEKDLQDLSVEPICRLIVDFLLLVVGEREPDAYVRLMDILEGTPAEDAGDSRERWSRFIDNQRLSFKNGGEARNAPAFVRALAEKFLEELGEAGATSLSPEYLSKGRLMSLIEDTFLQTERLLAVTPDPAVALAHFADDHAVRIMTVHKSKGLEFECVVFVGIENEMFWSDIGSERPLFFVGISRAKRRLVLTNVSRRNRPEEAPRWNEDRTPQQEFLGYALAGSLGVP